MQVTKVQNQPNFQARVLIPDAKPIAKLLPSAEIDVFEAQAKCVEGCGNDEQALHIIMFNAARTKPFVILSTILDSLGNKVAKFQEDISLRELSKAALSNLDRGFDDLLMDSAHPAVENEISAHRNFKRLEAELYSPNADKIAKHLTTPEIDEFEEHAKRVLDDGNCHNVRHMIFFTPSRTEPFAVLTQLGESKNDRIMKFQEDLTVKELEKAALDNLDRAEQDLKKGNVFPNTKDDFSYRRDLKRVEACENSTVHKVK